MSDRTPALLRDLADRIEARRCTGITATWCPVHGDCTCSLDDSFDPVPTLNDDGCPLHDSASAHGATDD